VVVFRLLKISYLLSSSKINTIFYNELLTEVYYIIIKNKLFGYLFSTVLERSKFYKVHVVARLSTVNNPTPPASRPAGGMPGLFLGGPICCFSQSVYCQLYAHTFIHGLSAIREKNSYASLGTIFSKNFHFPKENFTNFS
jgi:hypothetical protein